MVTAAVEKINFACRCNLPEQIHELPDANTGRFQELESSPMISNRIKGAGLASAAAFFAMSTLASAATALEGSTGAAVSADDTVHCYGVNTCKGTADCKTTTNSCKGMNVCKGHGFKAMKAGQCLTKGGTIGDIQG